MNHSGIRGILHILSISIYQAVIIVNGNNLESFLSFSVSCPSNCTLRQNRFSIRVTGLCYGKLMKVKSQSLYLSILF